jgi:hypothetical protein
VGAIERDPAAREVEPEGVLQLAQVIVEAAFQGPHPADLDSAPRAFDTAFDLVGQL